MDIVSSIIYLLDDLLDTKRKRHITGGILLSASMMFGGLAITILTMRNEKQEL